MFFLWITSYRPNGLMMTMYHLNKIDMLALTISLPRFQMPLGGRGSVWLRTPCYSESSICKSSVCGSSVCGSSVCYGKPFVSKLSIQKLCCVRLQNRLDCDKNRLDCDKNRLDCDKNRLDCGKPTRLKKPTRL